MTSDGTPPTAWAGRVGRTYLYYLALVPAAGTFSLLGWYHLPFNLVFFIVGGVAVAIYLAVENAYAPLGSVGRVLLTLVDGPAWVLAAALLGRGSIRSALVSGMLIEMSAILLGLFAVALFSSMVPSGSRLVSVLVTVVPLVGVVLAGGFYLRDEPRADLQLLFVLFGVAQAAWAQGRLIEADQVVRKEIGPLVVGLAAWILSTMGAMAFRYLR